MRFPVSFASVLLLLLSLSLLQARPNVAKRNIAPPSIKTIYPTFTTIDVPGAGLTEVSGINSVGEMVGFYGATSSDPNQRGFLISGGKLMRVDYPHAYATLALGINDSGLVVGTAELQQGTVYVGFTYDGTTFKRIRDGSDGSTIAYGVNDANDIVGGGGTLYTTIGFLESGRTFTPINFPGNNVYEWASAINDLGEIVGFTLNGLYSDSYLYTNGQFENIDVPGATQTSAFGINKKGMVVGYYFVDPAYQGFARARGKYVSFSYPGATGGTYAHGINGSGQVVGQYTLDSQTFHGFVTSPIAGTDLR